MRYVPIESKQITFVGYDEESLEMAIHYSTGEVRTYGTVTAEAYERFLNTPNRYDFLVNLTNSRDPAL